MRNYRSFIAAVVTRFYRPIASSLALCLALSALAFGQQQGERKRVPKLTTDDVMRSRPAVQVVDEPGPEGAKTDGKAEDAGKPATAAAKGQGADAKADPEQATWRDQLDKARERAKVAQRDAEETELRITQLRNQLGSSGGSARDRNETAAALDQMGSRLKEARAAARDADAELKGLVENGKQKGFAEGEGPKPTAEGGEPNEEYYKGKHAKLQETVQDADRRIQLFENRIRDLNERMNNPGADRFSTSQYQQERDEAQQKLDEAREARTKAQSELDSLMDEGRKAGVSPGVFR